MKRIAGTAFAVASIVALTVGGSASAHNAAHLYLPDGRCVTVGSDREAPLVGPDRVQLDLIPGPGDQYGARFAAVRSPTLYPSDCP